MKPIIRSLFLISFILSLTGCGFIAIATDTSYFNQNLFSESLLYFEKSNNKKVMYFDVYYDRFEWPLEMFLAVKPSLLFIDITIFQTGLEDYNGLNKIIKEYFEQNGNNRFSSKIYAVNYDKNLTSYYTNGKGVATRYIYKNKDSARDEDGVKIIWWKEDKIIHLTLGCSVACDQELLKEIIEKNLVAPMSLQSQKNYEIFKSRHF